VRTNPGEIPQEEENRRLEIVVENREDPQTVRSRGSCGEVNSSAIAYWHSATDEVRRDSLKSRVAISRVIRSRRSEQGRVASDPGRIGIRRSGFPIARETCIVDL
jgi:hypothetical protein